MKKLLSLLGAVGLAATGASSVVACNKWKEVISEEDLVVINDIDKFIRETENKNIQINFNELPEKIDRTKTSSLKIISTEFIIFLLRIGIKLMPDEAPLIKAVLVSMTKGIDQWSEQGITGIEFFIMLMKELATVKPKEILDLLQLIKEILPILSILSLDKMLSITPDETQKIIKEISKAIETIKNDIKNLSE